jgi:PAP2 superfamily
LTAAPSPTTERSQPEPRSKLRGWAISLYCAAVVVVLATSGIPFDRETVILVIIGALTVTNIGRSKRDIARVLFDWIPFTFVLLAYDISRGLAHRLDRPVAYLPQLDAEKLLFFGKVPSSVMQDHLYRYDPQWWDVISSLVYISHFIVPFAIAGLLWRRDWRAWRAYTSRFVAISFIAVVFFAAFPTAPPWAAAKERNLLHLELGERDGKTHSTRGLSVIGLKGGQSLIDKNKASANPYAAIPSLHSAFSLLVSITMWRRTKRRWVRGILFAYPIAMVTTLVYSGEHYVVDAIVGFALVWGVVAWEARTRQRRVMWWTAKGDRWWPAAMKYLRPLSHEPT